MYARARIPQICCFSLDYTANYKLLREAYPGWRTSNFIVRVIHNRLLSCAVHCPSLSVLLSLRVHWRGSHFCETNSPRPAPSREYYFLLNPASRAVSLNLYDTRHYREKMSHITLADVRCISHVGYGENIDSATFLTSWRERAHMNRRSFLPHSSRLCLVKDRFHTYSLPHAWQMCLSRYCLCLNLPYLYLP